jgi:hypothetical protein
VTRMLSRSLALILLASLLAFLMTTPASAKGAPSSIRITGPGISSPIILDITSGWKVFEYAGGLCALDCFPVDGFTRHRPSGKLGPRYTFTYTMSFVENHATQNREVVQYVYPYASPQPFTHTPDGQRFGFGHTSGLWFVADPRLAQAIQRVIGTAEPAPAVSPRNPDALATRASADTSIAVALAIAAVLLLSALVLWGALAGRRGPKNPGLPGRAFPTG